MYVFTCRLARACIAVLLCLTLLTGYAEAATSNTVREKYGLQLTHDVAPLKEELLRVQFSIRTIQEIELYNKVIASVTTEHIDERISDLTAQADDIYSEVTNGIDLPLDRLLEKEADYKAVVDNLNDLLGTRGYYMLDPISTPDEDLNELIKTASNLKDSIKKAGYYADIGDLKYYPVKGHKYTGGSNFGFRYDPVGVRGYHFHYGIDLAASEGTPVGAWFSGTVISTGTSYGSGNYVWIDHGFGVRTFYCHLSRIDVSEGQHVTQGTQIALSGNTGFYTTGPHLHLALYIDGTAVDPGVILG